MSRIALISILLLLAGCSGLTQRTTERTAAPQGVFELPAPSELRGASFIPGERSVNGDQYETAFPNSNVQVSGTALQFAAGSDPSAFADLSFAMYELDATGYSGQGLLGVDWQGAAPTTGVYIGLANWAENRWDWQLTPTAEEIDLGVYSDYVDAVSGHFLITVLSTRTQTMTLDKVYFGTPGLEAPTNVVATDGDFPDHVTITWDAPVDGPNPTGYSIWRSDDVMPRNYAQIGTTVGVTTYDDMTTLVDTKYWYSVKSTKAGEPDSALSAEDDGLATAGGVGWTISTAATIGVNPVYLTLDLVNNNPAIAYAKNDGTFVMYYTRAQDTAGSLWSAPKVDLGTGAQEPCLGFFGGLPGLCYVAPLSGQQNLQFRHGNDTNGATWDAQQTLHDPPGGYVVNDPDMTAVGGNPAIAFCRLDFVMGTGYELSYIRASDATGDTWPSSRVTVDNGEEAYNPQIGLLSNGFPAIIYAEHDKDSVDNVKIMFIRATDATGANWSPTPQTLYTLGDENTIAPVQFVIANGRPAAFFHDGSANTNSLYYKRASDANGDSWPAGAVKVADDVGFYDGATTVNGKPAAVFTDDTFNIKYLEATDTDGNSWLPAELIETAQMTLGLPTLKAFGTPQHACVAWRVDGTEIRFARKS